MAPTLVRFYGGTRQEWAAAPWDEACRFWSAIPRIRASEGGALPAGILSGAGSSFGADFGKAMAEIRGKVAGEAQMPTPPTPPAKKTLPPIGIGISA